ncbi:hypothetical protein KUTeg_011720 [Tegillarca granosa]|uniref:Calponin-homology (CH) domain-containing protein n=1 Tax=Tegillarca granosa TaxID=220873 RepID=A0ABQ9F2N7_TEGGR|nr:hypothetical protein KUTeg_011720 [Tegillarca granosa]
MSSIYCSALLEYCRPGLCPDWRRLDRSDRLGNCRNAMNMAKNNFDIPLVVRPEDLSSPDLDELSGMTYISYYMKIDSPGYHATMRMIRGLLKHGAVNNFTTDWADGKLLCNLVKSLGGIDGAKTLGVEPVLTAKEMADPEVDHIGIMAYAAYFSSFKPAKSSAEKVVFTTQPRDVYVNMESSFSLRIDDSDVSPGDIRAEIRGPDSNPPVHFNWSGRKAEGTFTPKETGIHRVNAEQAGQGDVQCEARAPGGRVHNIAAVYRHGNYVMNFNPSEVGVWQISVLYDGDHINGSPFQVHVYDPTNVKVYGLEGVDSSQAGDGDVRVDILHEGSHVPAYIHSQRVGLYKIDFTPQGAGSYTVHVFFNDNEVRGSPYTLDIVDSSRVSVHGDGLRLVPCHRTADFIIDTHGSSKGRVNVEITGDHKIQVYYCGQLVRGCPFVSKAYDAGLVIVSNVPKSAALGVPAVFDRSPWKIPVLDPKSFNVSGDGLKFVKINKPAVFSINYLGEFMENFQVFITGPTGRTVPAEIVSGTGEQRVEYVPVEIGDHRIEVKFNDSEVEGSPFLAKAYDASAINVTPITDTMVGHEVDFKIDVTRAGEGQLEIMVNNGNLPNNVEMERTGVYKISFVPIAAGIQTVDINFNKESIPGAPMTCMAVDAAGVSIQGLAEVVAANRLAAFTMVTESSGVSEAKADVVIYRILS